MDIATDSEYIGFVKFSLKKEELETFDFWALKHFKFEIYGEHYCKEIINLDDLNEIRNCAISPNENFVYIKIKIATLEQVNNIIDNFHTIPQKKFSMISYICDCGSRITVDVYNGQCPICKKDSPSRRKYKTKCPVCGTTTLKDKYGNGECENCGWYIDNLSTKNKNSVIYPNLISLNKAKRLYQDGKLFKPDLNDFLEALYFYSEMIFKHNEKVYEVFFKPDYTIVFCSKDFQQEFKTRKEFEENANINGRLLKNIWDEVDDPSFMFCGE